MSMGITTMVRRATTFASELIAVSITNSGTTSLTLSYPLLRALFIYLSPSRTPILHRIELLPSR